MSEESPPPSSSLSREMEEQKKEAAEREPSTGLSRALDRDLAEESPEAIEARANREANNARRAQQIKSELESRRTVEVNSPEATAGQIGRAFEALASGINEAAKAKIREYDRRIRAAIAGNPIKPGDTAEGLKEDFRVFTKKEWTVDYRVD